MKELKPARLKYFIRRRLGVDSPRSPYISQLEPFTSLSLMVPVRSL